MDIVSTPATTLDLWGYDRASLVIAWAFDKADGVQLLFGRVELRPNELGPGPATRQLFEPVKLPGPSGRRVFAGVVEMSASEAVSWYASALTEAWHVPPALVPGRKPPAHRPLGRALEEPVWPQLNLFPRPYAALPCVPVSLACPRVHHRLVAAPHPTQSAWSDAERAAASGALAPVIGFQLSEHAHLWESLRIVLPNPVLRSVGTQLVESGPDEGLGVTLVARHDAPLAGLRVTIWEERDALVLPLVEFRPREARTLVRLPGVREATAMSIDSDRLGRILITDANVFLKGINVSMNLVAMHRSVTAERPGKAPVQYEVAVHGVPEHLMIGSAKRTTTIDMLRSAHWAANEKQRAASDQEIWFSGDVNAAQARLRTLVTRASQRVWIVDYFFGASDAGVLLPAIGALKADIRVLTSREGLGMGQPSHRAAQALERVRNQLTTQFRMQPIEIRAMSGKAEIHDRFLVVDDRVYLLGSSVNNYGERGTMLVRLRATATVLSAIEDAWGRAQALSAIAAPPIITSPPPRPSRTTLQHVRAALASMARHARARMGRTGP